MATQEKKYPCEDCLHCQWCSDDRCRLCRKMNCVRKLSIAEQIKIYEQINNPKDSSNERVKPQTS